MTFGWKNESDGDRITDAFPQIPESFPIRLIFCPYCKKAFKEESQQEFFDHIGLVHPLDIPVLMVENVELPINSVRRNPIGLHGVLLLQTTTVKLQKNGGLWETLNESEFSHRWRKESNSIWKIQLIHSRPDDKTNVQVEYTVIFRIPDPEKIKKIDQGFVDILAIDNPGRDDLGMFLKLHRDEGTADGDYAGALGDYVLAIILKNNPQAVAVNTKPFKTVVDRMKNAFEILKSIESPVAQAVCSCIRFNMNWLEELSLNTAMPQLQMAIELFGQVAKGAKDIKFTKTPVQAMYAERSFSCPIDGDTARMIKVCAALMENDLSVIEKAVENLEERMIMGIMENDLFKYRVLAYLCWQRLGRNDRAKPHLLELEGYEKIERWVENQILLIDNGEKML